MIKKRVLIFADGASRGNPGRGGYGAIVIFGNEEGFSNDPSLVNVVELGGREDLTTNNKMELSAVISALSYVDKNNLNDSSEFNIYTDSKYVITGSKSWIFSWKRNGWKTATGDDVKNQGLWEKMFDLISGKKINWFLLPGHAGVVGNERCDVIATSLADKVDCDLFVGNLFDYHSPDILDIFYNPDLIQNAKTDKKSSGKAYSYVSKVEGKIYIDSNWSDCEKRVKGKKGVLFKKSTSLNDQENIIKDFNSR